jgi:hypothetical protein
MDYVGIVKRAAEVTWRHKILWLFGFFVGSYSGMQSFNYSTGGEDWQGTQFTAEELPAETQAAFEEFGMTIENVVETGLIIPILLGILAVLMVLGLVWLVIRTAAQGGLIHLANEGLEGREVRGMKGWGRGFHYWFRVFGVGFVLTLPFMILMLLAFVGGGFALFMTIAAAEAEAVGAAIGGALAILGVLALFGLLLIPLAVVFNMVREVALRHVVIGDAAIWESIKLAWGELWGKQGVFGMWLVQVLMAIAFGLLTGIVFLIVIVAALLPVGFLVFAGGPAGWILLGVLGFLTMIALILWSSAYAAFRSAAWTEFYRRMVGTVEEPAPETDDGMMAAATPA